MRAVAVGVLAALVSGCSGGAGRAPAGAAAVDPVVVYEWRSPPDRLLASVDADTCRKAGPVIDISAAWRLEEDGGSPAWRPIGMQTITSEPRCDQPWQVMAYVGDGTPPIGTYWIVARAGGREVGQVVVAGPVRCNDVRLGQAPRGMIGACIASAHHARAGFVPDPRRLTR